MLLRGMYFDGKTARGLVVQICCIDDAIELRSEQSGDCADDAVNVRARIADIELSPRLGRTRRQLRFRDGAVCEVDDDPVLDSWFASNAQRRWNFLARLESHWVVVTTVAVLVIALIFATAWWGMPWAAQKIALRIPQAWVDQLGSGALITLDEAFGSETELPAQRQRALRDKFSALARSAQVPAKFEFRSWSELGANALALPDSTIVVTDALVNLADDDRELLAVIAHELGHEHERHALQQLLSNSGVAGLIFVMTGDVSGLANITILAPTILTHLHHSRGLEREADQFGFAVLQKNHIETVWFARIIRKLAAAHADKSDATDSSYSSWLSTHPDSELRAHAAEDYDQPN